MFRRLVVRHGWRRALVIISEGVLRQEFAKELLSDISGCGVDVEVFSDVEANPRVHTVDACVGEYRNRGMDVIVGIGGGSALDQAKATAVGMTGGSTVTALMRGEAEVPERRLLLVLVPTTAGTGAEVSWGAILNDMERGVKSGIRGPQVAADYALVDPSCTLTVPVEITMVTGFDVLTHGIETFLSRKRSPYTAVFSRQAIETVFCCLPRLREWPDDIEGRTNMSLASLLMGMNLVLSSNCLPHRMQYPVGALTGCTHAEGLAALYPAWLDAVLPFATSDLATCASWVNPESKLMDEASAAGAFVEAVLRFMDEIGMRRRLSDFGIDKSAAIRLADAVDGDLTADPGDTSHPALQRMYAASV
jgi:alcohol dehydrogenase class IV